MCLCAYLAQYKDKDIGGNTETRNRSCLWGSGNQDGNWTCTRGGRRESFIGYYFIFSFHLNHVNVLFRKKNPKHSSERINIIARRTLMRRGNTSDDNQQTNG